MLPMLKPNVSVYLESMTKAIQKGLLKLKEYVQERDKDCAYFALIEIVQSSEHGCNGPMGQRDRSMKSSSIVFLEVRNSLNQNI